MIEVEDLQFSYNKKKVVNGVSFNLNSGEILGLLGPNGSGKTTIIKLVGGILKRQGGLIKINGKDIDRYI